MKRLLKSGKGIRKTDSNGYQLHWSWTFSWSKSNCYTGNKEILVAPPTTWISQIHQLMGMWASLTVQWRIQNFPDGKGYVRISLAPLLGSANAVIQSLIRSSMRNFIDNYNSSIVEVRNVFQSSTAVKGLTTKMVIYYFSTCLARS